MKLAALIVVLLVINSCHVEACPLGILYKNFRVYEWYCAGFICNFVGLLTIKMTDALRAWHTGKIWSDIIAISVTIYTKAGFW